MSAHRLVADTNTIAFGARCPKRGWVHSNGPAADPRLQNCGRSLPRIRLADDLTCPATAMDARAGSRRFARSGVLHARGVTRDAVSVMALFVHHCRAATGPLLLHRDDRKRRGDGGADWIFPGNDCAHVCPMGHFLFHGHCIGKDRGSPWPSHLARKREEFPHGRYRWRRAKSHNNLPNSCKLGHGRVSAWWASRRPWRTTRSSRPSSRSTWCTSHCH